MWGLPWPNIKTLSLFSSAQTLYRRHPDLSVPLCGGSDRSSLRHSGWHLEHRLHGEKNTFNGFHSSIFVLVFRAISLISSMCTVGFWAGHRRLSVRPPIRSLIQPRGRSVWFTASLLSLIKLHGLNIQGACSLRSHRPHHWAAGIPSIPVRRVGEKLQTVLQP